MDSKIEVINKEGKVVGKLNEYQSNNPDVDALMDYINILTGFKIRAYQWKKVN